jgi:hypothetical protein
MAQNATLSAEIGDRRIITTLCPGQETHAAAARVPVMPDDET